MLGLVVATALAVLICYVPPLNIVFGTRPFLFIHWLPGLPFAFLIYFYDEARKAAIRKFPHGKYEHLIFKICLSFTDYYFNLTFL
jgi:sodium/potassium-transporting ATPase subunit alpha